MSSAAATVRDYFLVSERLGFGIWGAGDDDLAATIWGDPEVTRLTGGPFTDSRSVRVWIPRSQTCASTAFSIGRSSGATRARS